MTSRRRRRSGTVRPKYLEQQLADVAAQGAGSILVPDTVLPEHIAEAIAERTGIPSSRMLESEKERLLHDRGQRISERVFGQADAVQAVAEAARRVRADLQPGRKPASFLFVGPTGVGKTELAKALAEALFDDARAIVRIESKRPARGAGAKPDLAHNARNVSRSLDAFERRGHGRKTVETLVRRDFPITSVLRRRDGPAARMAGSRLGIAWITNWAMQRIN